MPKRPPRTPHIRLVKEDPDISNKAARDYIARGWAPLALPFQAKGIKKQGWGKTDINIDNVDEYFPLGVRLNIGVILGPRSNDLADIDLDSKEAIALAPYFLPVTDAIFGRMGKPSSHWLYYIHDALDFALATMPFQDKANNDDMIVELRLGVKRSAQSVFPGSQHNSGDEIEWVNNGDPAVLTFAEAEALLKRLTVACLLLQCWPRAAGGRHAMAFLVGSFLARAGLLLDDIVHMVRAVATEAGDDEVADRINAARSSAENFMAGERNTYGLPQMVEQFGEERANQIAKLLDYNTVDQEEALERMNEQYCMLPIGTNAKMHIITFRKRGDRQEAMFLRPDEFKTMLNHERVGKVRKGTWWLGQAQRKQRAGLVFRPGEPEVVDDELNLWKGFGIQEKEGKWPLMRAHIKRVLAAEDKEMDTFIVNFSAWTFQNPGIRAEVALVLRGIEGCGKGVYGRAMKEAFGQHGLHISDHDHLVGKFNKHLMDCALLFCDEAWWPGHKASDGTIKRMLTEPTLLIEPKRVDSFEVNNCLHVIMAANAQWVVAASAFARRFAVSNLPDTCVGNKKYFNALYQEIHSSNGIAAMMWDLRRLDLKGWHPRDNIPKNMALHEQQMLSLAPFEQFWLDLLQAAALIGLNTNLLTVPSEIMYKLARDSSPFLKNTSNEQLATKFKYWGCVRNDHYIENNGEKKRVRGFKFLPLKEMRARWKKEFPATKWENEILEWEKMENVSWL
jgi:hypothetical protein